MLRSLACYAWHGVAGPPQHIRCLPNRWLYSLNYIIMHCTSVASGLGRLLLQLKYSSIRSAHLHPSCKNVAAIAAGNGRQVLLEAFMIPGAGSPTSGSMKHTCHALADMNH